MAEKKDWNIMYPLGATVTENGVKLLVEAEGDHVELLLFQPGEAEPVERIELKEEDRMGTVWSIDLSGHDMSELEYGFEVDGTWISDPCAKAVAGRENWGAYEKKADGSADDTFYVAYNMHWGTHFLGLPKLPRGKVWKVVYDTSGEDGHKGAALVKDRIRLQTPPRSVVVLTVWGETRSYKDIAVQIGDENACRAVGAANNKNPLAILVPCHRVVGSDGTMVGYAGGLNIKEALLSLEGRYRRVVPSHYAQ